MAVEDILGEIAACNVTTTNCIEEESSTLESVSSTTQVSYYRDVLVNKEMESQCVGDSVDCSKLTLADDLSQWFVRQNLSCGAMDDLLQVLSSHVPDSSLPKSYKTLLKTPLNYSIVSIQGGFYHHFGIECRIRQFFKNHFVCLPDNRTILLQVGIDGVPISKSSRRQMWPILVRSKSILKNAPFLVGLYYSELSKPENSSEYLRPFVEEIKLLATDGMELDHVRYDIEVVCFIADAPARSFLKQIVSFNGQHGCERCNVRGQYTNHRMIFKDIDCPLRTNEGFVDQVDVAHHTGISPLVEINFPMVTGFVLDYMHLICMGIVKKLLLVWKAGTKKSLVFKLSRRIVDEISTRLLSFRKYMPKEFGRKPRSLYELQHWKATEFRTFLLYTGPLALKGVLDSEKYNHFMLLSVAIRILLTNNSGWHDYADSLLRIFVSQTKEIYSEDFLIYNVHNLIHITDDARKFGSLNGISAFAMENYMQKLKSCIKGNVNPLAQVIRREFEAGNLGSVTPSFSHELLFSTKLGDRAFLSKTRKTVLVQSIDGNNMIVKEFQKYSLSFSKPCESSKFDIYKVSCLSKVTKVIPKSDLIQKVVLLPHVSDNPLSYYSIPLLNLE